MQQFISAFSLVFPEADDYYHSLNCFDCLIMNHINAGTGEIHNYHIHRTKKKVTRFCTTFVLKIINGKKIKTRQVVEQSEVN